MDIVSYFTKLTKFTPTTDQRNVLESIVKDNKILISAGRQSGKTLTVSVAGTYLAFEYGRPVKILLISAQENIVYFYMKQLFRNNDSLEATLVSKSARFIIPASGFETTKGSHVFVRGVSERSIRGTPADVVIIDEACLVPNESIITALGNLSGNVSKLILLSTPTAEEEHLFNKWMATPKDFKTFHWSSEGLPWHTKMLMDTKKEEYNPQEWATEVLGRPPTEEEIDASGKIIGDVIFSKNIFQKASKTA